MRLSVLLTILFPFLLQSCVTSSKEDASLDCAQINKRIEWTNQIDALNKISELFRKGCYKETIASGTVAREKFRHKTYSVVQETMELFVAEGAITDYVLESYERGYLSFLIASSYLNLRQTQDVWVELNRFYNEEVAQIYNNGRDPVNALLQAAMWDNLPREGFSSRPFWLWLSQGEDVDKLTRDFAKQRVKDIDAQKPRPSWQIAEVGRFPGVDWSMKFTSTKSGYFKIKPKRPFPATCADTTSILLPTTSWFKKIAIRHSNSYHPLVNAKSWIRLPFGIVYGISTAAAGAAILVGGCAADIGLKGNGELCNLSVEGGVALISKSDDVVDAALQPDLRHWEKVPEGILVSAATSGKCLAKGKEIGISPVL